MEHQREYVEHFPYGKQIGDILDLENFQKRHRGPKHIFWASEISKSSNSGFFFKCAQRSNVGDSFLLFFPKHAICDFLWTCKFCMFFLKTGVFPKNAT